MGIRCCLTKHQRLRTLGRNVLNFLFPERCFVCGDLIDDAGVICPPCWFGLSFVRTPCCSCCGHPFEYAVSDRTLWCLHTAPAAI